MEKDLRLIENGVSFFMRSASPRGLLHRAEGSISGDCGRKEVKP